MPNPESPPEDAQQAGCLPLTGSGACVPILFILPWGDKWRVITEDGMADCTLFQVQCVMAEWCKKQQRQNSVNSSPGNDEVNA